MKEALQECQYASISMGRLEMSSFLWRTFVGQESLKVTIGARTLRVRWSLLDTNFDPALLDLSSHYSDDERRVGFFNCFSRFEHLGHLYMNCVGCGARGALAVYHVIPLFAVTDTNLTGRGEGVRILPSHYDHIKQQHQRCLFRSVSLNFVTAIAAGGGGNWNDHFEFEILIGIGGRSPNQPHLYSNQNWSQNKHFVALFSMLGHLPKVSSLWMRRNNSMT